MSSQPNSSCDGCEHYNADGLKRLGVDVSDCDFVVALAGNPNTGKSTVFNSLTGLRQHTGNWPGKTVTRAEGGFSFNDKKFKLIDLPGTYSLLSTSQDEEVARNFILFGRPDVTVIVVDAGRLERNLNLVLQILEITDKAVLCLNLIDEAKRHNVSIDERSLAKKLGIPVVATSARFEEGIPQLIQTINDVAEQKIKCNPYRIKNIPNHIQSAVDQLAQRVEKDYPNIPNSRWIAFRLLENDERVIEALEKNEFQLPDSTMETKDKKDILAFADSLRWNIGENFHDSLTQSIYTDASKIAEEVVKIEGKSKRTNLDTKIDQIVTSRMWGFPIMLMILSVILWLTIEGANVPSSMLAALLLDTVYPLLKDFAASIGMTWWLSGFLIDGVYLALAWVISVMLPPMAIFFPLFTLLEDFGYLPRVAFNLDKLFKDSGADGKQALTMSMGWGCNAAGVIATRIIDSPRERLIAIITNNFSLCNGRWPTQILIASIFIGALAPPLLAGLLSTISVIAIALLGVFFMFVTSYFLSRTVLRGEVSTFTLELPPYRPPRLWRTLYTSLIDRTLIVLWRACVFAAPAGAVIWLISNVSFGDESIASWAVNSMDSFGLFFGLNGVILLAYVVAIPANEIVIPTILMLTVMVTGNQELGAGAGVMFELDSMQDTGEILRAGGWTLLTGINLMLFSLLHNPCSTTIYTIYQETKSVKWTTVATLLPVAMGFVVCFLVAQFWLLFAG